MRGLRAAKGLEDNKEMKVIDVPGGEIGIPQTMLQPGKLNRVRLKEPLSAALLDGWYARLDAWPGRRFRDDEPLPTGKVIELWPMPT